MAVKTGKTPNKVTHFDRLNENLAFWGLYLQINEKEH
jgi:hypothetical protein